MRDRLQALLEKFAVLSARERMLVLLAVFAIAYQIADLVVLDRQYQRIEALNRDIARDNAAIVAINTELNVLAAQAEQDPNKLLREQLAAVRAQNMSLQQRLKSVAETLISPRDMARFIEKLLVQEGELTMLSLKTLKTEPLLPSDKDVDKDARAAKPVATLHKHGFEIAFSGGYLPTLRYLKALEGLPWEFFWDSVNYEVVDYPDSIVRLRLHTLSLSEDWIGV